MTARRVVTLIARTDRCHHLCLEEVKLVLGFSLSIADRARYSRRWSRYTVATYRSLLLSLPRAYQRVLRHSLRELVSGYFAAYNYQWPPLGWEEFLEAAPRVRETLALPYILAGVNS
eukprot:1172122-Prorocentrum_minimum.AAC.1